MINDLALTQRQLPNSVRNLGERLPCRLSARIEIRLAIPGKKAALANRTPTVAALKGSRCSGTENRVKRECWPLAAEIRPPARNN
jgi:hypothetical protein